MRPEASSMPPLFSPVESRHSVQMKTNSLFKTGHTRVPFQRPAPTPTSIEVCPRDVLLRIKQRHAVARAFGDSSVGREMNTISTPPGGASVISGEKRRLTTAFSADAHHCASGSEAQRLPAEATRSRHMHLPSALKEKSIPLLWEVVMKLPKFRQPNYREEGTRARLACTARRRQNKEEPE